MSKDELREYSAKSLGELADRVFAAECLRLDLDELGAWECPLASINSVIALKRENVA